MAHQFNEMTRSLRNAQKLEHERQAIENELNIATEIQASREPEPGVAGRGDDENSTDGEQGLDGGSRRTGCASVVDAVLDRR